MEKDVKTFNLRVYGLLIEGDKVLVTDEHRGIQMTKFPGGGLEKGEGIADCLIREFMEELELPITVGEFFYVNDFLQLSAFNPTDQLFSFYYFVSTANSKAISVEPKRVLQSGEQTFRWIPISELDSNAFTFPIDQKVVDLLIAKFK